MSIEFLGTNPEVVSRCLPQEVFVEDLALNALGPRHAFFADVFCPSYLAPP